MNQGFFLVIPSYNDSERLRGFLPELCLAVRDSGLHIRIQVVDDGSEPKVALRTNELVEKCREEFPNVLSMLKLETNLGKGGAVYRGWEMAVEDWLAFVDADGAVSAKDVVRLCEFAILNSHYDGVLGSRVKMMGHRIDRTFKRHLVGRVYATLANLLIGIPVYDSQCGFKILKKTAYEAVKDGLKTTRFGFDMELIAFVVKRNFLLIEVPLESWTDIPGGKVRLVRDSWDMFCSLLALRKKSGKSMFAANDEHFFLS
jgi:dolichyl-phosphate beta-glucosyltransferase